MKYFMIFLYITTGYSFEMPGCDIENPFSSNIVYYLHQEAIIGPHNYIKLPTAWYQLKLKTTGEVDENGLPVSFPTWDGLGLCMLGPNGKIMPYNLSKEMYPQWRFEQVKQPDIALNGKVRSHAVYKKYILQDHPDENGKAVWLEAGYYQNGNSISYEELEQKRNLFQNFYRIKKSKKADFTVDPVIFKK